MAWLKYENPKAVPPDLVPDILVRLPINSLVRFNCVSKSWIALPHFVSDHRRRNPDHSRHLGRRSRHHPSGAENFLRVISGNGATVEIGFPSDCLLWKSDSRLISLSGLICLRIANDVVLCNPATREFWSMSTVGVGDPTTRDHKRRRVTIPDAGFRIVCRSLSETYAGGSFLAALSVLDLPPEVGYYDVLKLGESLSLIAIPSAYCRPPHRIDRDERGRVWAKRAILQPCLSLRCADSDSCPIKVLNDELLTEIILRVNDIKCTFRCMCVCKHWFRLINPNPKSDPYFIRLYLSRLPDQVPKYCLLHSFAYSPFQATTLMNIQYWFKTGFSLSFLPIWSRVNILSSSNGLILCCPGTYDHSAYFICNPVTRQWLSLPPPPLCSERARLDRVRVLAGFAFQGKDGVNAGCGFRVFCFPSRNESFELAVEVFSSETGQWATRFVERTWGSCVAISRTSCFETVAVCNGIAYWLEHSVFTAFNLWDNSFHFFPAPCSSENRVIRFFEQSQGFLRAVSYYIDDAGPSFEVYVLKDSEWFMERMIRLRQLTSTSNWLSQYPWRRGRRRQQTLCIAFHPQNSDVVYMRCNNRIVECNMLSGEWREIDKVEGGSIWDHRTAPLMLPWWPTPVPKLPK